MECLHVSRHRGALCISPGFICRNLFNLLSVVHQYFMSICLISSWVVQRNKFIGFDFWHKGMVTTDERLLILIETATILELSGLAKWVICL